MACLWLATKVEEFNISIAQFVENLQQNPADAARSEDLILALELPVIHAIKYHLTIHNPYRPLEGFLIDLRTRCPQVDSDALRPHAIDFLSKALKTDAALLFPPSIIAITACVAAASSQNLKIDTYILEKLFSDQPPPALDNFKSQVKKLRSLVKKNEKESMDIQLIGQLKNKLERCRNPEFKDDKLLVFVDDDENEGKANDMAVETISTDDLLDF